jgi:hypothetical protein
MKNRPSMRRPKIADRLAPGAQFVRVIVRVA